jgi:hypothetical protein
MSEGNFKELLIRHIEKLALGLVALIIIVYLLSLAASTSEPEKLKTQSDDAIAKIETAMDNPWVPEPVEVDYTQQLRDSFDKVPQSGKEPRWFAFKRPYVVRRAIFVKAGQPVHRAPTLSAEAEAGQVKLAWVDNEVNEKIEIVGYTLRRKKGDGDWMNLEKFDSDVKEYTDKAVKPDTRYAYRLTSKAEKSETNVPLANKEQYSEVVMIEIQFNMEFETNGMMPFGNRVKIRITYVKPGGEKLKSQVWIERDKMIKVKDKDDKDIETGWKLKDFGEKNLGTKKEKFIVIVNSEGKTKRFPKEEEAPDTPAPPEEPEEPEEEPDEPEEPPKKGSGDDGGGWLPPK